MDISATFNGENGDQLAKLLNDNGVTVKVNLESGEDKTGLGILKGITGTNSSAENTGVSATPSQINLDLSNTPLGTITGIPKNGYQIPQETFAATAAAVVS
jgi:hypothetical protein